MRKMCLFFLVTLVLFVTTSVTAQISLQDTTRTANIHAIYSPNDTLTFERAKLNAELGNADAQYALALYYDDGVLVDQSDSLRDFWLRKSAEQEYIRAYFKLALTSKDKKDVIFWSKKDVDAEYFYYVKKYGEKIAKKEIKDMVSMKMLMDMGIKYKPWESYTIQDINSQLIAKRKSVNLRAFIEDDGYRWIKKDSLGFEGALDIDGNVIIPCLYGCVEYVNKCFMVKDNENLSGLYDTTGKILITPYQNFRKCYNTDIEDTCYICGNYKYGVLKIGDTATYSIPQLYKKITCYVYGEKDISGIYHNYYFECLTFDNRVEIYDKEFKLIISKDRSYSNVTLYKTKEEGVLFFGCRYIHPHNNMRSAVCDLSGKELIKTKYYFTFLESCNGDGYVYRIEHGQGVGILNNKGEIISKLQGQKEQRVLLKGVNRDLGGFYFICDINGVWRIEDLKGNLIVENILNGGSIIYQTDSDTYFKTQIDDNAVIFKDNGECIIDESYNYYEITCSMGYFLCVNSEGKTSLHDKDGKMLYGPIFDILQPYDKNLPYIVFADNNKYGILNYVDNQLVVPPMFDDIDILYGNDALRIKQGCLYGLCDHWGNVILDLDFNSIDNLFEYYHVQKNGFCGIYKLDGTPLILPNKYTHINPVEKGFEAEVEVRMRAGTVLERIFISNNGSSMNLAERDRLLAEYKQEASVAFDQKRYRRAIKYYSLAIDLEPKDEYLFYNRGASYYNINKYQKAIADFQECIHLDCSSDIRDKAINLIEQSKMYYAENNKQQEEIVGALFGMITATTSAMLGSGNNNYSVNTPQYLTMPSMTLNNPDLIQNQQWNQQLQQLMQSTIVQVNNKEMQDYYNFCIYNKKRDGSDYTILEWRAMQSQAMHSLQVQGEISFGDDITSTNNERNDSSSNQKKCPYCNGKGRVIYEQEVVQFGINTDKKWCEECQEYIPARLAHTHIECRHCKGSGLQK